MAGEMHMSLQQSETGRSMHERQAKDSFEMPAYPMDMSVFLALTDCTFETEDEPCQGSPKVYDVSTIAQYALAYWNRYLISREEHDRSVFLAQAKWLVKHEVRIDDDAGGWPISMVHPDVGSGGSWLSALVQGCALSVLIRAYKLTGNDRFLNVAQRVARTFERDILDGGVSAPIGENGIFFEEVAVYPAVHRLSGSIFALLGLNDYVALCDDPQIEQLIQCSHMTMHRLLDEFDVGFWISTDLLHRHLASPAHFAFQIELLGTLATYTVCESCSTVVARWKRYEHSVGCYLRYLCAIRCSSFGSALLLRMRSMLFPSAQISDSLRVCIPVTSFPFTGVIQTVLEGIAQVTKSLWHIEYLA